MPDVTLADKLRDMAEHRGLKLVKSRRRKPGTGDYGKFGLTDAAGKSLLGIGDEGLEASADDIEAYLRAGAECNWKASAESMPAKQPSRPKPASNDAVDEEMASAIRPRRKTSARTSDREAGPPPVSRKASPDRPEKRTRPAASTRRTPPAPSEPPRRGKVEDAAPPSQPSLVIRAAKPADAEALVSLLRELSGMQLDELGVARNLKAALKADAGMAVAELGDRRLL